MRAMLEYMKDVRYALLKKSAANGDTYVGIYVASMTGGSQGDYSAALAGSEGILLETVEPKAMEQKIVTLTADEIDSKMAADGRIAIYGIYFDFDKAVVKSESKPQLDEIAKLMKANPELQVLIVGHTDNKGKLAYNQSLSLKRAKAVVDALVKTYGIPAARMTAVGVGPAAPLASNDSEEGQAKNRRVELVKM
jgi:outer membrane protein OmpA-like peptidoglycan-associated protein